MRRTSTVEPLYPTTVLAARPLRKGRNPRKETNKTKTAVRLKNNKTSTTDPYRASIALGTTIEAPIEVIAPNRRHAIGQKYLHHLDHLIMKNANLLQYKTAAMWLDLAFSRALQCMQLGLQTGCNTKSVMRVSMHANFIASVRKPS